MKSNKNETIENAEILSDVRLKKDGAQYWSDNVTATLKQCIQFRSSHRRCSLKKVFLEI